MTFRCEERQTDRQKDRDRKEGTEGPKRSKGELQSLVGTEKEYRGDRMYGRKEKGKRDRVGE